MAIMQGITGKLSGKMGSAVFRVHKGAQVVAQYNPNVSNPKSKGQNDQRAKFKLASQLAAEVRNDMAFNIQNRAGHGAPTQRNEFIKANLPEIAIANEQAKIAMAAIKLTNSMRPFSADIGVSARDGDITVGYVINDPSITQVVAVLMGIRQEEVFNGNGTMSVLSRPERRDAKIVNVENGRAQANFTYNPGTEQSNSFSILTYAIEPTSSAELAITNNAAAVQDNVAYATNDIQRNLRQQNIQVTMTRGFAVGQE